MTSNTVTGLLAQLGSNNRTRPRVSNDRPTGTAGTTMNRSARQVSGSTPWSITWSHCFEGSNPTQVTDLYRSAVI